MHWRFLSGDADIGRVFVVKIKKILEGKTEYYTKTAVELNY